MAADNVAIANMALTRLGAATISAFSDQTPIAEAVNSLYEATILQLLGSYPWRFAQKRASLTRAAYTGQWLYQYPLPAERTERVGQVLAFFPSTDPGVSRILRYEVEGDNVLTDELSLVAEYIERVAEASWPGYFETLATEAVAAVLALPVTENASKEEFHRVLAYGNASEGGEGGLFGVAVRADTRGASPQTLLDTYDPITHARFGGL